MLRTLFQQRQDRPFSILFWIANFGFGKRGLFRKAHFLEIPEILEHPHTLENKGESDDVLDFLEILENLEILEILEIKDPFRNDPSFRSRQVRATP